MGRVKSHCRIKIKLKTSQSQKDIIANTPDNILNIPNAHKNNHGKKAVRNKLTSSLAKADFQGNVGKIRIRNDVLSTSSTYHAVDSPFPPVLYGALRFANCVRALPLLISYQLRRTSKTRNILHAFEHKLLAILTISNLENSKAAKNIVCKVRSDSSLQTAKPLFSPVVRDNSLLLQVNPAK